LIEVVFLLAAAANGDAVQIKNNKANKFNFKKQRQFGEELILKCLCG